MKKKDRRIKVIKARLTESEYKVVKLYCKKHEIFIADLIRMKLDVPLLITRASSKY